MGGLPTVGGTDEPGRWYLRMRVENRAEPGKSAEALQTLRVVKSPVRRPRQGCPLERQCGRHRLVRGDLVCVPGKSLDLGAFYPEHEPEFAAVREVPPRQQGQGRTAPRSHNGHACASPRRLLRLVWA